MPPTRCMVTIFLIARLGLPVVAQQPTVEQKTTQKRTAKQTSKQTSRRQAQSSNPAPTSKRQAQSSNPAPTSQTTSSAAQGGQRGTGTAASTDTRSAQAGQTPATRRTTARTQDGQPNTREATTKDAGSGQTTQTSPASREEDHTVRNVAIGAAAAAGAAAGIAALVRSRTPLKQIDKNGPEFLERFQMSTFQVRGFVRGGWPLVIDYEAPAGTYALLGVGADRVQPYMEVLETGASQRNLVVLTIPPEFGNDLRVAAFSIRATLGPNDPRPSYFRVYGFGCGPRAVGSVAIDNLKFSPPLITSKKPDTNFGFRARTNFDKVKAEFMQITLVNSCIEGRVVDKADVPGRVRQEDTVLRPWSGKKARPGQIQFRVRGWMDAQNGGDWVSAFSPDFVLKQ